MKNATTASPAIATLLGIAVGIFVGYFLRILPGILSSASMDKAAIEVVSDQSRSVSYNVRCSTHGEEKDSVVVDTCRGSNAVAALSLVSVGDTDHASTASWQLRIQDAAHETGKAMEFQSAVAPSFGPNCLVSWALEEDGNMQELNVRCDRADAGSGKSEEWAYVPSLEKMVLVEKCNWSTNIVTYPVSSDNVVYTYSHPSCTVLLPSRDLNAPTPTR